MDTFDPSAKPLEHRVPVAELTGQFAPLRAGAHDPKNRLHEKSWIAPSLSRIGGFSEAIRLYDGTLRMGQDSSGQGCSPLFATLKQNSGDLEIPNVNSALTTQKNAIKKWVDPTFQKI
jgi:hypothetical protein